MQYHRVTFTALILCGFASIVAGQSSQAAEDYYNRAAACYKKGDLDGAIANFTRAIESSSRLVNTGRHADAAFNFDQVKVINPLTAAAYSNRGLMRYFKMATAYYGRGVVWSDLEKLEQAIGEFNRAIELDPELAVAYGNRGLTLLRQGKDSPAESDLSRALALDPSLKTELEEKIELVKQWRRKNH